jgi:hypothetical protein
VGDNAAPLLPPPRRHSRAPIAREWRRGGGRRERRCLPRGGPPLRLPTCGRGARDRGRRRVPPAPHRPLRRVGARDRRGHECGRGHACRKREPRGGHPAPLVSKRRGRSPSVCLRGCRANGGHPEMGMGPLRPASMRAQRRARAGRRAHPRATREPGTRVSTTPHCPPACTAPRLCHARLVRVHHLRTPHVWVSRMPRPACTTPCSRSAWGCGCGAGHAGWHMKGGGFGGGAHGQGARGTRKARRGIGARRRAARGCAGSTPSTVYAPRKQGVCPISEAGPRPIDLSKKKSP